MIQRTALSPESSLSSERIFSLCSMASPSTVPERTTNLVRFTQAPRGGHFAPLEEPEFYAEELRAFFRPYRA